MYHMLIRRRIRRIFANLNQGSYEATLTAMFESPLFRAAPGSRHHRSREHGRGHRISRPSKIVRLRYVNPCDLGQRVGMRHDCIGRFGRVDVARQYNH